MPATHFSAFDLDTLYLTPVTKVGKSSQPTVNFQVSNKLDVKPWIQLNLPSEPNVTFPIGISVYGDDQTIVKKKLAINKTIIIKRAITKPFLDFFVVTS